jgi:hypothetical protein
MPLLLGEPANEEEAKASDEEASGDDESERVEDADEGEMVAAWLRILPGDEDSDDDDGDDGGDDGGDGDGDLGDDEDDEDPPEVQDLNMEPLPAENVPNYPQQQNAAYFRNKRYVRTDKLPLDRFMVLANIASDDTDAEPSIEFPELYEIYK